MSDETTQNGTSAHEAKPDLPTPNGASNGAPSSDAKAEASAQTPQTPKKKKKKKARGAQSAPSMQAPTTDQHPAAPAAETAAAPATEPATEKTTTTAAPTEEQQPQPDAQTAAPVETAAARLRLRVKVWTDPETAQRYIVPTAFMRDLVNGQPVSDVMYAYATGDGDAKPRPILLRASEWNALPFFYFQEDGPAPRTTAPPAAPGDGSRPAQ